MVGATVGKLMVGGAEGRPAKERPSEGVILTSMLGGWGTCVGPGIPLEPNCRAGIPGRLVEGVALGREVKGACPLVGRKGVERTTVTGAGMKDSGNFGGSEIAKAWSPDVTTPVIVGFSSAPAEPGEG